MSVDRKKYLNKDEVKRLQETTKNKSKVDMSEGRVGGVIRWMVVDLALTTGLRVSEMAAIRLKDIDGKRRSLTVTRLKRKHRKPESLAMGKELSRHLRQFTKWKRLNGDPMFTTSPLFLSKRKSEDGKLQPLTAKGLQWIWAAAIKAAGLPAKCSIHCARHTMATHLLKKTNNLRQVQKQLGHASPATTANMYADISWDDMDAGVSGLYA